ncbi:MAG: glutathione peroxidase [Bacteroidia bacterium]
MISLRTLLSGFKTYRNKADLHYRPANGKPATTKFHNIVMNDISGRPFHFAQLAGKKTLLVNTASECKFTEQYASLEKFYGRYKDKVNVLGFPCNDFGEQESGPGSEIHSFCQRNYGVSFTLFEKVSIKGEDRAEVYKWLSDKKLNGWCNHLPHWNFCKYLVDEKGELLLFTNPVVEPDSAKILQLIA